MGSTNEQSAGSRPVSMATPWASGVVRRARREADLSQRELARALGVAQSTVARWETGRSTPTAAHLERLLALAGLRLAVVDDQDRVVQPMADDRARDRARRRLPAHLDPYTLDWWTPRRMASWPAHVEAWQRSRRTGTPSMRYLQRGPWRDALRRLVGVETDHPSTETLAATLHRRDSGHEQDRDQDGAA